MDRAVKTTEVERLRALCDENGIKTRRNWGAKKMTALLEEHGISSMASQDPVREIETPEDCEVSGLMGVFDVLPNGEQEEEDLEQDEDSCKMEVPAEKPLRKMCKGLFAMFPNDEENFPGGGDYSAMYLKQKGFLEDGKNDDK